VKVVYVAHPLGSGPEREENRKLASRWVARIGMLGYAPVADWIILSGEWDDTHRERGLAIDLALIARCDEVWLVGPRLSPGMTIEAVHGRKLGKRVENFVGVNLNELDAAIRAATGAGA
jgi:hypothetical protein